MIPPTGGPRDTVPPKLISVTPPNNSTHFDTKRIVFNFDEYLELKDLQQNLTVSPVPKQDPLIEAKLRTLTVRIRDTLQPNTTYTIDFGNAVRDINESNILKKFSYIYSTGAYIDSINLSGNIILAATGKTDSTILAMLYANMDDSAVIKEKPRYIARCDSSGHFTFTHLRPGTYRIYALKDEGGQRKYLSKSQIFAFADEPVDVGGQNNPITLYAYIDTAGTRVAPTTKKTTRAGGGTEAKPVDKDKPKRLIFTTNAGETALDVLGNFDMQFGIPLKTFDSTKISFSGEQFNNLSGYRFQLDSTRKKLTLMYKWGFGVNYHLIAAKDFAEDSLGNKLLKIDTITFRTRSEADYGSLRIRFTNLPMEKNPVLQFMLGEIVKKSQKLTSPLFYDKLFLPGEYELRILYDTNNNGVWDPGEFFIRHKQPERVINLKPKLTVKANWDNQPDYVL